MYKRVGMGAVFSADGTDFSYPPQCNYSFWSDPLGVQYLAAQLSSDCAPPTPAQIQAMQVAQLSKVAAVNPDLAASGIAAGNKAVAGMAVLDPNGAANYYGYQASPVADAILGPSVTNWIYGINPTNIDPNTGDPKPATGVPGWVWIGSAILVFALVAVKR